MVKIVVTIYKNNPIINNELLRKIAKSLFYVTSFGPLCTMVDGFSIQ